MCMNVGGQGNDANGKEMGDGMWWLLQDMRVFGRLHTAEEDVWWRVLLRVWRAGAVDAVHVEGYHALFVCCEVYCVVCGYKYD